MINRTFPNSLYQIMRKPVIILFVLLYFAGNSYAHVDMHFCCGQLVDWSLFGDAQDCGGKDCQKKNCCKDVSINIESADEHTPLLFQIIDFNFHTLPLLAEYTEVNGMNCNADEAMLIPFSKAPPNVALRKIYLLCEVFRL